MYLDQEFNVISYPYSSVNQLIVNIYCRTNFFRKYQQLDNEIEHFICRFDFGGYVMKLYDVNALYVPARNLISMA